jgi:hypothetical protein
MSNISKISLSGQTYDITVSQSTFEQLHRTSGSAGLKYTTDPDSETGAGIVTIGTCTRPDIIISAYYETISVFDSTETATYKVTQIGQDAFENCTRLQSITMPDTVESIGIGAFYNCTNLKKINFSNSIKSIDNFAFINCSSLTEIVLPKSVKSIGSEVFVGCTNLKNILIPSSVEIIDDYAFSGCTGTIYCEATSKPDGWMTDWDDGFLGNIVWGAALDLPAVNEQLANITKPDGQNKLINEDNKINMAYLSDSALGQVKFGGIINIDSNIPTIWQNEHSTQGSNTASALLNDYISQAITKQAPELGVGGRLRDYYLALEENSTCYDVHVSSTNGEQETTIQLDLEGFYFITEIEPVTDSETNEIISTHRTFADIDFVTGDWLIAVGGQWQKVDNTDAVMSVNSKVGNVVLNAEDIADAGSNITISGRTISAKDTTYTADKNSILTLKDTTFDTPMLKKGSAPQSLVIDANVAITKPDDNQIVINEAIALTMGDKNTSGRMGYWYNAIEFTSTECKVYLTKTQPTGNSLPIIGAGTYDETINPLYDLTQGDVLCSIVNNSKFENCAKILSIDHNIVSLDRAAMLKVMPNPTIVDATDGGVYELDLDDYSFSVTSQPAVGECQIKNISLNMGAGNITSGNENAAIGRGNNVFGDYAFGTGYGNEVGYCSMVGGANNKVNANYSFVTGGDNIVEGQKTSLIVGGKRNQVTGNSELVTGEDNIVSGNKSLVSGSFNTVNKDLNAVSGDQHVVNGVANIIGGRINTANSRANIVGGISNVADGTDSNTSGMNILGGLSNNTTGSKNIISGGSNSVSSDLNLVVGSSNTVTDARNIVGGDNNKVSKKSALVVGYNNTVEGSNVIVSGESNTVKNAKSIVSGGNNILEGDQTLIVGDNNTSRNTANIVGGRSNIINSRSNVVVGYNNKVNNSTAAGNDNGNNLIGGNSHELSAINSVVVGHHNNVAVKNAVVAGCQNEGNANYSLVVGTHNNVTSVSALIGGSNNKVTGNSNVVVGVLQTVSGEDNIVSGEKARTTSGSYNIVNGSGAEIKGSYNIVNGVDQKAINGSKNIVGGNNNTVSGDENLVVGGSNTVNNARNIVGGQGNTVHRHSLVVGSYNNVTAENTIVGGSNNAAISLNAVVSGTNNIAGLKGFYWSDINLTAKTITVTSVNGSYGKSQTFNIADYWTVGDIISINNDQKWDNCAKIKSISSNTITVESNFPFTSVKKESGHVTDQAIFVLAKPDKGLCDFGQYSVVFGENNKGSNFASITVGRQNQAQGQYAAVFGRQNVASYACLVGGRNNEIRREFGFASGSDNYITSKQSTTTGKANFIIENAHRATAMGAYNTIGGDASTLRTEQGVVSDGEYKSANPGQYAVALGYGNKITGFVGIAAGDNNIVSSKNSVAIGMNNTIEASQTNALILSTGTTPCSIKGTGDGNLLLGGNSTIETDKSKGGASYNTIIGGDDCHITGGAHQCVVGGKSNTATGYRSTIFGYLNNDGAKQYTTILGTGNIANADYQTLVGKYSKPSTNTIFVVGNGGSSKAPSNAFEVTTAGNVVIAGSLTINGVTLTSDKLQKVLNFIDTIE